MNERVELKEFYLSLITTSLFSFAQLEMVWTSPTVTSLKLDQVFTVAWPPQTWLRSLEAFSLHTRGYTPENCLVSILKCLWHHYTFCYVCYVCMHANSLQLCPTLCDPIDCSPPGSSSHGVLQARILGWVSISCSRGSLWIRDQPGSPVAPACRQFLTAEPPGKPIKWVIWDMKISANINLQVEI